MGRTSEAKAIIVELKRRIQLAKEKKEELINYLQNLRKRQVEGTISYSQYREKIYLKRNGRDIREWIEYYDEYIEKCEREISYRKKDIVKKQSAVVFLSLFFVFLFLIAGFYIQPKLTGFAVQAPEVTEPLTEIDLTKIETTTEEIISETNTKITTSQYQAVLGQPVRWKKEISLDEPKETKIKLPKETTNISVKKIISYSEDQKEALLNGTSPSLDQDENLDRPLEQSGVGESSSSETENETELSENIIEETNETTANETGELSENITEETNESYSEETEGALLNGTSPSLTQPSMDGFTEESSSSETNFSITGAVIGVEGEGFLSGFFKNIFGRITGRVVSEVTNEEVEITIDDNATEYKIEYETPAPYAIEEDIERGKRVKIVGPETIHYENVLAFTNLPENLNIQNPSHVKIHWIENNTYINPTSVQDTNDNGIYDYVEWIAPHLSNQTFEIIIEISKA